MTTTPPSLLSSIISEIFSPDLFIVELAPQQLVFCSIGAELDLPLDHFRQIEHPIQSFFSDQRTSRNC